MAELLSNVGEILFPGMEERLKSRALARKKALQIYGSTENVPTEYRPIVESNPEITLGEIAQIGKTTQPIPSEFVGTTDQGKQGLIYDKVTGKFLKSPLPGEFTPKNQKNSMSVEQSKNLVDSVLKQPELFDTLAPSQRTTIIPELVKNGFIYEGKPLSTEALKVRENALSGLRSIQTVKNLLKNDPSIVARAATGKLAVGEARTFNTAIGEITDVITRLRTGAALNNEEQSFYNKQNVTLLDLTNPDTIDYKLNLFSNLFNGLSKVGKTRALTPSLQQPTQNETLAIPPQQINTPKILGIKRIK